MQTLSATSTNKQARTDLELLQGAWVSTGGRREAELLIAGSLFAVKFLDGGIYIGTLDLDPDETPRQMIMRIDEGPIKHKGKFAVCIYAMEGETLRWCPTEPGSDERLTGFPGLDDGRYLCLTFRRETPRRPG